MTDFFNALIDPNMPIIRYALIIGIIASFAFGIIGTYIVVNRISYIAGAISHSIIGGIGAALYFQKNYNLEWCHPNLGALVSAIFSAGIICLVLEKNKQRADTVIGAVWAIGMATGLLFISKTPGGNNSLHGYLFGDILLVSFQDLLLIIILDLIIMITVFIFYNKFLAVSFDREYAKTRGINTALYHLILLILIALTIVLLLKIIGIIMLIALLTLPPAIAGRLSKKMLPMMLYSTLLSMLLTSGGIAASYQYNTSCGPTIILLTGALYLISVIPFETIKRKMKSTK